MRIFRQLLPLVAIPAALVLAPRMSSHWSQNFVAVVAVSPDRGTRDSSRAPAGWRTDTAEPRRNTHRQAGEHRQKNRTSNASPTRPHFGYHAELQVGDRALGRDRQGIAHPNTTRFEKRAQK
jgi:hypothetical protein